MSDEQTILDRLAAMRAGDLPGPLAARLLPEVIGGLYRDP